MAPGYAGFLGCALRPDGTDHKTTMPENIRRLDGMSRTRSPGAGRPARSAEQAVRPAAARRAALSSHNEAYERVRGLMASEKLFDISQEPQKVRDRYGPTQFGEQVLVARRLVEAGRAVRPRRPGLVGQPRPELRDPPGDGPGTRPRHGHAASTTWRTAACSTTC